MYKVGDTIDGKYVCTGLCSDSGGMGRILFVEPIALQFSFRIVLKYCREADPEFIQRFKREVRLLLEYQGNSKIVEVVDHNVSHDPPYFVMRYYPDGDLLNRADWIRGDIAYQERVFSQMIDCVAELHATDRYHRDIKPQNFLVDGDSIVVSDFGVSKELHSFTGVTRNSMYIGTEGYVPPEFIAAGGFKNADAAGDIFMLGKSFYVLLSGRDPRYPTADGIPAPLFAIVERCCETRKEYRYDDLGTLKQRLTTAFDVVLGRKHAPGEVEQLLAEIQERFRNENKYSTTKAREFVDLLLTVHDEDRTRILFETKVEFFNILACDPMRSHVPAFLDSYRRMAECATYSWSYAEVIATHMRILFSTIAVEAIERIKALEIAIIAADRQNRYAAMDICRSMIFSIRDEGFGMRVAEMLSRYLHTFIGQIEPASCSTHGIRVLIEEYGKRVEENEKTQSGA